MTLQWIPSVQLIQDTVDYVRAQDTNRPLKQLEARTRYLYERLRSVEAGEALIAQGVVLDPSTRPGSPVYFDPVAGSFKPAWAGVVQSGADYGYATGAAQVKGLVLNKSTSTGGDVLLSGKARNTYEIDWTQVIDGGSLEAGTYFVSAVTPGNLTRSRSVLSVYVGTLDSSGTIIFTPEVDGNLRNHLHYKFPLVPDVVADLNTEGWAPISAFTGSGFPIPGGATHGYVISKNAELAAAFPPVPLTNHYLEFVGRGVHEDAYILDQYGLWWVDGAITPDALATDANFSGQDKYYTLWVSKLQAETSIVTSLDPSTNPNHIPVVFRTPGGLVADAGALVAAIESLGSPTASDDLTGTAVKTISGARFTLGPAVSTIIAGDNISVEATAGNAAGYHGVLRISAGTSGVQIGDPSLVALNNAIEDYYGSVPSLVLPKGRVSSITVKVNIPTNFSTQRSLRLVLDLIGTATLSGQALGLAYQRVRVGTAITSGTTPMTPFSFNMTDAQVTRVTSDTLAVQAGDTVFFTITQTNAGVSYSLPILRVQYELTSA